MYTRRRRQKSDSTYKDVKNCPSLTTDQKKQVDKVDSNYSSLMVVIKKKDGTNRICIDYQKLNQITITDIETFQGLMSWIHPCHCPACFQNWTWPESKHLTAFSTSLGLYEFNFTPFGLVNAPATFVRMMRALMKGIPKVVSCIHIKGTEYYPNRGVCSVTKPWVITWFRYWRAYTLGSY